MPLSWFGCPVARGSETSGYAVLTGGFAVELIVTAVVLTAGLVLLIYMLGQAVTDGWASTRTAVSLAIVAVPLFAFVFIERRAQDPLILFSSFRLRALRTANLTGLLMLASW